MKVASKGRAAVHSSLPLFEFENVHYTYPIANHDGTHELQRPALTGVSFRVEKGEYVAIVGPNGSGKSTLAKLMTGLLTAASGEVRLFGKPLLDYAEAGELPRLVGLVFQDPDMQSVATVVEEDVAFALENLQVPLAEMRQRVENALRRVHMWDYRLREPHSLSGGQKQRVAVASVIAPGPACIIFDEATSMLDTVGRREVNALMQNLAAQGHTVISITHRMEEAAAADRVIVLDEGMVAMDAPPSSLFADSERLRQLHLSVPMAAVAARCLREQGVAGVPGLVDPAAFATYVNALGADGRDRPIQSRSQLHDIAAPDQPGEEVIRIQNLSHTYMQGTPMETQALKDVSLTIRRGEMVAIIGTTGSGKSTFSLYLNGLYEAAPGQVTVLGMDGADKRFAKSLRQRVGMLFQRSEEQIFEALIGDEIAYAPFRFGATVEQAREAVREAMDTVGIDSARRDRPTYALSGGQRRRVAFASVLAAQPDILVLDEPTAALDPLARQELLQLLRRLQRERGMTIVFVTHQLEEVIELADRVLVLQAGKLAADTTPRNWLSDKAAVERLGFELPEIPAYIEALCRRMDLRTPGELPQTQDEAKSFLAALLHKEANGGM